MAMIQIDVAPILRKHMDHLVKTKHYGSVAEVVREALRRFFDVDVTLPKERALTTSAAVTISESVEPPMKKVKVSREPFTRFEETPDPNLPTHEEITAWHAAQEAFDNAEHKRLGEIAFAARMLELSKIHQPTKAEMDTQTDEARKVYRQLAAKKWPIPEELYFKWRDKYPIAYRDVIEMEVEEERAASPIDGEDA